MRSQIMKVSYAGYVDSICQGVINTHVREVGDPVAKALWETLCRLNPSTLDIRVERLDRGAVSDRLKVLFRGQTPIKRRRMM